MVRSREDQKEREEDEESTEVQVNPHRWKKRKSRAPRNQPGCREPRNAKLKTLLAWDANNLKDTGTLRKYGTGFRCAWKIERARKQLVKAGFRAPGCYRKSNQTGGRIFALPREVPSESRFGEEEAGLVMRHVLKSGCTRSQGEGVKKMLSFVRQLQTGDALVNFKRVNQVWKNFDPRNFQEPTQVVKAVHIIDPEPMKTVLTTEWTQEVAVQMAYHIWCLAYLIFHHWNVLGLRPKEDMKKVKTSQCHVICPSHGYFYSEFNGGRAKLDGTRGERPWKAFGVCYCEGGKHKGPPENFRDIIIDEERPTWNTACPLTCFQVIRAYLDPEDPRIFPQPLPRGNGFCQYLGKEYKSIGPKAMFSLVRRFIDLQGGNPDGVRFCSNSGRHALGKLCNAAGIPYPQSFEIHGDLFKNWRVYQELLANDKNFSRRNQSKDINVVLKPLWTIARWFGKGPTTRQDPPVLGMEKMSKLLILLGRKAGLGAEVNRILDE